MDFPRTASLPTDSSQTGSGLTGAGKYAGLGGFGAGYAGLGGKVGSDGFSDGSSFISGFTFGLGSSLDVFN